MAASFDQIKNELIKKKELINKDFVNFTLTFDIDSFLAKINPLIYELLHDLKWRDIIEYQDLQSISNLYTRFNDHLKKYNDIISEGKPREESYVELNNSCTIFNSLLSKLNSATENLKSTRTSLDDLIHINELIKESFNELVLGSIAIELFSTRINPLLNEIIFEQKWRDMIEHEHLEFISKFCTEFYVKLMKLKRLENIGYSKEYTTQLEVSINLVWGLEDEINSLIENLEKSDVSLDKLRRLRNKIRQEFAELQLVKISANEFFTKINPFINELLYDKKWGDIIGNEHLKSVSNLCGDLYAGVMKYTASYEMNNLDESDIELAKLQSVAIQLINRLGLVMESLKKSNSSIDMQRSNFGTPLSRLSQKRRLLAEEFAKLQNGSHTPNEFMRKINPLIDELTLKREWKDILENISVESLRFLLNNLSTQAKNYESHTTLGNESQANIDLNNTKNSAFKLVDLIDSLLEKLEMSDKKDQ